MRKLKYIKSKDIEKVKWDSLLEATPNGNIFCYSWYLDAFCKWDIIVLDDYKGGLALPVRNISWVKELYQPNFIQKCIWFGSCLDTGETEEVCRMINRAFILAKFNSNLKIGLHSERTNLVLRLDQEISVLRSGYSRSLRKNLKKAYAQELKLVSCDARSIISIYQSIWGNLNKQISQKDYDILDDLAQSREQNFVSMAVVQNNVIVAGVLLLKGKDRLHYILGANTPSGREVNALSFLIDTILEKYSMSHYVFDFEGSSIPSVKSYYLSFGAINEPFYEVDLTSPWITRLKKNYKRLLKS